MARSRLKRQELLKKIRESFVFIISGLIILSALIFLYIYRESFFALIPGFFQFDQYEEFMSERNDLIDENNSLLEENSIYVEEINKLGTSEENFTKKKEQTQLIGENLSKINDNLNDALVIDKKTQRLRLHKKVLQYATKLKEIDEAALSARTLESEINSTRAAFFDYRIGEAQFNTCVAEVDRSDLEYNTTVEKQMAETIASCLEIITTTEAELDQVEEMVKTELPLNTTYIQNTKQFWQASYEFHNALAGGDFDEAEKYDAAASEYKRGITDMDIDAVYNEFDTLILDPMEEELASQLTEVASLQTSADEFFQENFSGD